VPSDPADSGSGAAAIHDAAQTDSSDAWNVVTSRYWPPLQTGKSQTALVSTEQKRKPHKKLFGVVGAGSGAVKSGVEIICKYVVHVDNLDVNCTPALYTGLLIVSACQCNVLFILLSLG